MEKIKETSELVEAIDKVLAYLQSMGVSGFALNRQVYGRDYHVSITRVDKNVTDNE